MCKRRRQEKKESAPKYTVKNLTATSSWDLSPCEGVQELQTPQGEKHRGKAAAQKSNRSPGLLAGGRPFGDCPFCLFALYGLEDGIIVDKGSTEGGG